MRGLEVVLQGDEVILEPGLHAGVGRTRNLLLEDGDLRLLGCVVANVVLIERLADSLAHRRVSARHGKDVDQFVQPGQGVGGGKASDGGVAGCSGAGDTKDVAASAVFEVPTGDGDIGNDAVVLLGGFTTEGVLDFELIRGANST